MQLYIPSQDGAVDTVTKPKPSAERAGLQFPAEKKGFCLFSQNVQSGSGTHPGSYSMDTMVSFPGDKAAGA